MAYIFKNKNKCLLMLVFTFINASSLNAQFFKDSITNKLIKKLDSNVLNIDGTTNIPTNKIFDKTGNNKQLDTNKKNFWEHPFTINIPKTETKLGGQFGVTAFYTDVQNPRNLNERQYIRVNGTPEISIAGLPFSGNFNYTTENNTVYNSNIFSFNFDKQRYIEQVKQQAYNEISINKKELSKMNSEIQKQHFDIANLKRNIEYEKRKILGDSISASKLIKRWENELTDEIAKEKQTLSKNKVTDSTKYFKKIANLKEQFNAKVATLNQRKLNSDSALNNMVSKSDQLKDNYEKKQHEYEVAKKYIQNADSIINNPELLMKHFIGFNKGNKTIGLVSKIENFNTGNVNPFYGDLMLNGLPVRGIDIKYQNHFIYKLTAGKTFSNFVPIQNNINTNNYNRYLLFGAVGFKNKFGEIFFNIGRIWDDEKSKNKRVYNHLIGLQAEYLLFNRILIKSEILGSDFKTKYNAETSLNREYNSETNVSTLRDKLALNTNFTYNIASSSRLLFVYRSFGSQFTNIGNPFIRKDFREYRLGIERDILNKKIIYSGFYYANTDNLRKINNSTNSTKGFGFQGQTNFSDYPNLGVSYIPFTQGTTHPDSLLISNNHFSTKTATISYQKVYKFVRYFIQGSFSDGIIQFGNEGTKMHNRNMQSVFSTTTKKWQTTSTFSKSFTDGKVDTLSYNLFAININYKANNNLTLGIQQQTAFFNTGGLRISNSLNFRYKFMSRMSIQLQLGNNYIENIWGIDKLYGLTAKSMITIRL